MRWKRRYVCSNDGCGIKSSKKMWNNICNKCHEKIGSDYTAGNYHLKDLSQHERMLVFLYACGQDISGVFEKGVVTHEHTELKEHRSSYYEDLEELPFMPSFILEHCFPDQEM